MSALRSLSSAQGGYILIMLCLMVGAMVFGIVRALDSTTLRVQETTRTTKALREAKEAVIATALVGTPPGQLPCQEATGFIGSTSEGAETGSCGAASHLGRLPWRSLKLQQIPDASGEQLWYAISPSFRTAPINSLTTGQLTLNGISVAAIIFAPGVPLQGQSRPIPTATNPPQAGNYLDGINGIGGSNLDFSTFSAATNDIAIGITAAELLAPLEKEVLAEIAIGIRAYYAANGSMPTAPLSSALSPYILPATNTWLTDNNWYSVVQYTSANSQSTTITVGSQTLIVQ